MFFAGSNEIMRKEGGYVSYREDTESFVSMFSGNDNGDGETAIVVGGKFYILNGDFREELKGKTIAECLKFFAGNQDKASEWSEKLEEKEV